MDTNLHDPRGKIRCIQQAENEKVRKAETLLKNFSEYVKRNGLKPIDEHKRLLKELRLNDGKEVKEQ
jgi:hypothetical protein|nr:MAG TPA: hypothetical protein [Caudoviricetes sp.]